MSRLQCLQRPNPVGLNCVQRTAIVGELFLLKQIFKSASEWGHSVEFFDKVLFICLSPPRGKTVRKSCIRVCVGKVSSMCM